MTVIGKVLRGKGQIHKRRVVVDNLSASVTVPAGGTATVTFNIATEVPRKIRNAGIESISIPSGTYIQSISVDKNAKTLSVTLYNPGASDVSGTVTVTVVSVA